MSLPKKLKILCLHGYRQNAAVFREKTGGFRKSVKKYVKEFKFLEGPCLIKTNDAGDPREDSENEKLNERGWWFSRKDGYYKSTHDSDYCSGLEESIKIVSDELLNAEKNGEPYDGIVAFSQGACLMTIISHQIEFHGKKNEFPFKFMMLFSGFKSAGTDHQKYYENKFQNFESFHSVGLDDKVVVAERGLALAELFENSTVKGCFENYFRPESCLSSHSLTIQSRSKTYR